ncbi:unnamed protein product [Caenorhabditis angaria]|uniref:Uncharacterized protein n=1 Tax=Caenorhabditis angaria TaxID=860376 RepID=A0A9P1MVU7_9PELO|nr:unnamed protein product [Caenorhabditis angaria]
MISHDFTGLPWATSHLHHEEFGEFRKKRSLHKQCNYRSEKNDSEWIGRMKWTVDITHQHQKLPTSSSNNRFWTIDDGLNDFFSLNKFFSRNL